MRCKDLSLMERSGLSNFTKDSNTGKASESHFLEGPENPSSSSHSCVASALNLSFSIVESQDSHKQTVGG